MGVLIGREEHHFVMVCEMQSSRLESIIIVDCYSYWFKDFSTTLHIIVVLRLSVITLIEFLGKRKPGSDSAAAAFRLSAKRNPLNPGMLAVSAEPRLAESLAERAEK